MSENLNVFITGDKILYGVLHEMKIFMVFTEKE